MEACGNLVNNILWTGGDSTFRILDLVLVKNRLVQPYYVIDLDRKSTKVEIGAMRHIKGMIFEKMPEAMSLMKDTIFVVRDEIRKNDEITARYRKLRSTSHLGEQYDWLTRLVIDRSIDGLELYIHKDDKAEGFIRKDVVKVVDAKDFYHELIDAPSISELKIFRHYRFPVLEYTKTEMGRYAEEHGFDDIMEHTWFCYNPTKDGKPCGLCNPCRYTREEGLGRRVPPVAMANEKTGEAMNLVPRVIRYIRKHFH